MSSVQIREHLIETLHADLIGPMAEDEVLDLSPARWYLTGFLVPAGALAEERHDPLADEQLSNALDDEPGEEGGDDATPHRKAFLPSSIGLSCLVPAPVRALEVEVSWAEYERVDPEEAERLAEVQARQRGREADPVEDDDPDAPRRRHKAFWRRVRVVRKLVSVPVRNTERPIKIPGMDGVYLRIHRTPTPDSLAPPGTSSVALFLVNHREPPERGGDELNLYQARLVVRSHKGFVPRTRQVTEEHPDDRRNDLQFRDHAEWAVGHGVATETGPATDGLVHELRTTWMPRAEVHRTRPTEIDGVVTSMEALAALEDPLALRGGIAALTGAYRDWIETHREAAAHLEGHRQRTALELLEAAELALGRIEDGVEVLVEDPVAWRAFQLANRAMAMSARREREGEPRWRLFQLAFVLLNLRGVADPTHVDRERVDLLFFPTGGGKTEAYLGVAAFVLLLRRLRGAGEAHGGAGVAVLLRYTLRLLTLDQLRRAAQLVCALELLRREQPAGELGHDRFSIGLWVGRKATHNRLADVAPDIRALKEGRRLEGPPPVPFKACPWCKTPLGPDSYALWPVDSKAPTALLVGCQSWECPFAFGDRELGPRDGIPVVVVDEHVYRELPGIVVGTVDKFASLPWRGDVGALFGKVMARDEAGFYGHHAKPPPSAPVVAGLPPPELIIQDELHLISGPLGTMVGLYETAIDALCHTHDGHGPKILASTATVRRATEQIQALFARPDTRLFPPQGPMDGDTFFAVADTAIDKTRVYVGVAAPGISSKKLTARVYTSLLGAAQRAWERAGKPGTHNPADTYMTLVAYFNALRELGGAQRLVLEEVATRTRHLSERRPVEPEIEPPYADRVLGYDVLELTSRQSTDDIAAAIAQLGRAFRVTKADRHDVLLASSMISVGVDISRLGLMVVNGQPRTVAEYIQASSRVGRETPGLVVTAYNLFKARDRSHYERFTAFHESFYRSVEATSVTPFSARAIDRGLAGLVVGLARHLGDRMAPAANAARIREVKEVDARLIALLRERVTRHRPGMPESVLDNLQERIERLAKEWRYLVAELAKAGGGVKYSSWERHPKGFQPLLSTAVEDLRGEHGATLESFRAPTSMRDVEPSVHIWVDLPMSKGAR